MIRITDFHTHVLPRIDDGSSSVEESILMLQKAAEQGIERVIATPHFYAQSDTPERFLARRQEAENRLREAMEKYSDLPELLVGAEVYFFHGISDSDILHRLTIAEKGCILIEMPHAPWTERMLGELEGIWRKQGLWPILAHVDRYLAPFKTRGIMKQLERIPVSVQANAEFFLQKSTRKTAMRLLREDRIHLLGSDCHNLRSRVPNLGDALRLICDQFDEEMVARINWYGQDLLGE